MTLGERIKKVRGALSQADFGRELGVSQRTIGHYEKDERSPDSEFLRNVCTKFRVAPWWLLLGAELTEQAVDLQNTPPEDAPNDPYAGWGGGSDYENTDQKSEGPEAGYFLKEVSNGRQATPSPQTTCPRCAELEGYYRAEIDERRALAQENRYLSAKVQKLLEDNASLRLELERLKPK